MRLLPLILLASAGALALSPAASAKPRHHARRVTHERYAAYAPHAPYGYARRGDSYAYPGYGYDGGYGYRGPTSANADATLNGNSFNAGAAQIPPPGTYNGYYGPGATVLRRGLEAQFEPGVTSEFFPGAKQTATGGPSGGIPGSGSGR